MSATAAQLSDMYPHFNARHLIGALLLLALLNLLPIFGIGPTTWRQCLGVTDTEVAMTPAPQALPTPPPTETLVTTAQVRSSDPGPAAPVASTSVSAPPAPAPAPAPASESRVVAAEPAALAPMSTTAPRAAIYFGEDDDDLPADARGQLAPIVAFLKAEADAKVRISGYHDPRGDLVYNEDLAYRRAIEVRAALERAGIKRGRIIIAKPAKTVSGSKPERAQRTEVMIVR